ncbi:MAG: type II toxin-antitoxin system Phd/YefM family antitoxin [Coriobacteriia bacterium]|nr:type II toxin-antitoxin system Phd/YefM family antitoxin [Coriobacteriia bacterium]
MHALDNIRPITDLRTKQGEVCALATETREPVILTKNGVAAYLLFDRNAYEAQMHAQRVQMALREAEIEERYRPETLNAEESDARMQRIFAEWGIEYA